MAESPDYQPIDFAPYPPTPASYVTGFGTAGLNAGFAQTLSDFSDGKLYVLKSVVVSVVLTLQVAATVVEPVYAFLYLNRGLANTGVQTFLGVAYASVQPGGSGVTGGAVNVTLEAPTPLVFRAAAVAGQQTLLLKIDGGVHARGDLAYSFIAWPVS